MVTLLSDFGKEAKIQLHLDAAAAKGIIERKGLSKVRHIDVNVLWLQETCARKDIPLQKVAGELNPADMMTKHLGAAKIDQNIKTMRMKFEEGRSSKAAKLHSVGVRKAKTLWSIIKNTGHARRGGDNWRKRGEGGVWHRDHTTPRLSLFTPYKVARGPPGKKSLNHVRFTYGVTERGRCFEFHDDWTLPERRHKLMEEPWVGFTVFAERGVCLSQALNDIDADGYQRDTTTTYDRRAWADICDDE